MFRQPAAGVGKESASSPTVSAKQTALDGGLIQGTIAVVLVLAIASSIT